MDSSGDKRVWGPEHGGVTASSNLPPAIPDHELLRVIGKGSYGEVWLAKSVLGTLRAVKVVRRDAFGTARPFEREFAGIQRFEPISRSHEGLVDVLQVGRNAADGFFYYVMELADPVSEAAGGGFEGYEPRSLATDLAGQRRLPVEACVKLFHGLAMALAHLHGAGLVHRDIKPSNLIYVNGVAKFADIGLVTSADDSLSYVGTEGFIPPEGAGTVSADLYSLGKVLYECGTGKDRTDFPSLPMELAGGEAGAGLMELNAIWLKACAQTPAERYQRAEELAAELALLEAGRSVKGLRVVERRLRRARQLAAVVAVLAAVAAGGGMLERREAALERASREQERRLRERTEVAERFAQKQLAEARVAQASAVLQSQRIGRGAVVLDLLSNAVPVELRARARSLAASALALPDLSPAMAGESAPLFRAAGIADAAIQVRPDGGIRVESSMAPGGAWEIPSQGVGEAVREPLILSSDRRFLYAGYGRYVERVWELASGRKVAQLDTNYYAFAFRPGHAQAAVHYVNGDLVLHELPGWTVVKAWPGRGVEGFLEWSADGGVLAFAGAPDGKVELLQPERGEVERLGEASASSTTLAWDGVGRRVAVASADGYVRVRDLDGWPGYSILARHEARVIRALFLPPVPWILTSSWDGSCKLWDWHAGQLLGQMEATGYDITYHSQERGVAWRLGAETARRFWKVRGPEYWHQLVYANPQEIGGPFMAAFAGTGRWVAIPDTDAIRVLRMPSLEVVLRVPGYSQSAWVNADGTELWGFSGQELKRWGLREVSVGRLEVVDHGAVAINGERLAVSQDGTRVAVLSGARVELLDRGERVGWEHGQELAESLAMSPDGRWLAVGTRNHIGVRVFDLARRVLAWERGLRYGTHVAFSSDSAWLAVGTDSGCQVLQAGTGVVKWQVGREKGEDPTFWEVAFSPDGTMLAWTSKPSLVRLLAAQDGRELLTLDYPTRRFITGLGFSPDGRWLAETSNKHTLHLWDLERLRSELGRRGLGW